MNPRPPQLARVALLAAGLAAPLLPPLVGAATLAAILILGFARFRPPRRERWIALFALLISCGALVVDGAREIRTRGDERAELRRETVGFAGLWGDLDREAAEVAARVEVLGDPGAVPLERLFSELAEFSAREGGWRGHLERLRGGWHLGRRSMLLVDPDGVARAWAGEGLLHELGPEVVPRRGRRGVSSFGGATLMSVRPIGAGERPWRVVVGASFATDVLPFRAGPRPTTWTLVEGAAAAVPETAIIALPDTPRIAIDARRRSPAPALGFWRLRPTPWARVAWGAIGLAVLALAVLRGSGRAVPGGTTALELVRRPLAPLVVGGALGLGVAAGAGLAALAVLATGVAIALAALGRRPSDFTMARERGSRRAFVAGALAVGLGAGGAFAAQSLLGPVDVGGVVFAQAEPWCFRLGLALSLFGLLFAAGRRARGAPELERWGWLSVVAALAGGAAAGDPAASLPLLAAAGAAAARWVGPRGRRLSVLAGLLVLAAAIGGGVGETASRACLRRHVERDLPALLVPPRAEELRALRGEIESWLANLDLLSLVPRDPRGLRREDLAFALWRRSPLARASSLSALVIRPLGALEWSSAEAPVAAAEPSVFSFGLPLDGERRLVRSGERWLALELPPWSDALLEGEVQLSLAGRPWAVARYSFLPRPGFRLADRRRLEEIDLGLLRGGPAAVALAELPAEVDLGIYEPSGRAWLSPWDSSPPLPAGARRSGLAEVETPEGPAHAVVRDLGASTAVLFLPWLRPWAALERAGNAAVGVVAVAAGAALLALVVVLPRAAVRKLIADLVRSYSRRLLLVYGALLLLPLALLNAVLVRAVERRLADEQRAAGQAALASAQSRLAEVLAAIPPGFSVETTLDDALLSRISELVHHEVNLYYQAKVYASSKHELFTSGLLPERIPGDIFAVLALGGEGYSSRVNRAAGGAEYLEIYAPVRAPGGGGGAPRLFLSAPLLAQQEEAAGEIARLRRRALLATAALLALLIAVGSRLAKSFTHPIRELVEGTARIAAGAPTLGFAPAELELAELSRAIDAMARRIAEGRDQLVREKQVVERMIDTITAGVVSLDRNGRVLLSNQVAAELLGVALGDRLEVVLAASPRLAPVLSFLRETRPDEPARRTVRLAPAPGAGDSSDASGTGGKGGANGGGGAPTRSPAISGGGEREWTVVRVPVPGAGEPSELLVVEDATEELRAQRLLAWAEMARIIAHEIKNPLTPIRLSTEHLREVWQRDRERFEPVLERCTTNILAQVDELRQIALEFSTYSSIPRIDPEPADLVAAMKDLLEGYRTAPPPGVEVGFEAEVERLPARFDARLLGRAVRNLLENAIRASAGAGQVVLRVAKLDGRARISVLDTGPGVPEELLPRIFDPYFSTHDTGTGLGLPIARRIAEEHGGTIAARNRAGADGGSGLAVTIEIPAG